MKHTFLLSLFTLLSIAVLSQGHIAYESINTWPNYDTTKTGFYDIDSAAFNGRDVCNIRLGGPGGKVYPKESQCVEKDLMFVSGKLYEEDITVNGYIASMTRYYANGKIFAATTYRQDSLIYPCSDSIMIYKYYKAEGFLNYYNKRGVLEIIALYNRGEYKKIIYYYKDRHSRSKFKRDIRDNPFMYVYAEEVGFHGCWFSQLDENCQVPVKRR